MSRTTVGALLEALDKYDRDMPVIIPFAGGGAVAIEPRDLVDDKGEGESVIGIYNDNGGRFGHDPLTEDEYRKRSHEFIDGLLDIERPNKSATRKFTTIHGDYRIYNDFGHN